MDWPLWDQSVTPLRKREVSQAVHNHEAIILTLTLLPMSSATNEEMRRLGSWDPGGLTSCTVGGAGGSGESTGGDGSTGERILAFVFASAITPSI